MGEYTGTFNGYYYTSPEYANAYNITHELLIVSVDKNNIIINCQGNISKFDKDKKIITGKLISYESHIECLNPVIITTCEDIVIDGELEKKHKKYVITGDYTAKVTVEVMGIPSVYPLSGAFTINPKF